MKHELSPPIFNSAGARMVMMYRSPFPYCSIASMTSTLSSAPYCKIAAQLPLCTYVCVCVCVCVCARTCACVSMELKTALPIWYATKTSHLLSRLLKMGRIPIGWLNTRHCMTHSSQVVKVITAPIVSYPNAEKKQQPSKGQHHSPQGKMERCSAPVAS